MELSYVTEEAVLTRTAAYKTPEWEQEEKIGEALRFHAAKLLAESLERVDDYSRLNQVNIRLLEMKATESGWYYKAVYSIAYGDHVGFALEELSKHDTTHCLSLRVVMQHSDPAAAPWLAQKTPEDQCVRFGRELWTRITPVTVTTEDWEGDLTCCIDLPGHTSVPAELIDAWEKITTAYTTDGEDLVENQFEEYEGAMTGGGYVSFEVKGSDLSDLLAQLQALSDACCKLGGSWTTEGYLYSAFSVLSFDTDENGKVTAEYIGL